MFFAIFWQVSLHKTFLGRNLWYFMSLPSSNSNPTHIQVSMSIFLTYVVKVSLILFSLIIFWGLEV
jgi:hypothetical protein